MGPIKHAIEEHDVVALRVPFGRWPVGTNGTAVSLYEGAALVEVAEDEVAETIRPARRSTVGSTA